MSWFRRKPTMEFVFASDQYEVFTTDKGRTLERHQADIARELQDLIETIGQEHTRCCVTLAPGFRA